MVLKFPDSVITKDWKWPETVECVWSKSKSLPNPWPAAVPKWLLLWKLTPTLKQPELPEAASCNSFWSTTLLTVQFAIKVVSVICKTTRSSTVTAPVDITNLKEPSRTRTLAHWLLLTWTDASTAPDVSDSLRKSEVSTIWVHQAEEEEQKLTLTLKKCFTLKWVVTSLMSAQLVPLTTGPSHIVPDLTSCFQSLPST